MTPAPYLSVIVPTYRVGGLDVLFAGLARQTFKDFELVLVDALYTQREHLVVAAARDYLPRVNSWHFDVTHLPPSPWPPLWPACSFCRFSNTAIAAARGEIILQFADYTWAPPDLLATHAAFHRSATFPAGHMGPQQYLSLPELDGRFPRYGPSQFEAYKLDIAAGLLNPLMWSILANPMEQRIAANYEADPPTAFPLDPIHADADLKLKCGPGRIPAAYFHSKNESFRREDAIAINGYDEDLDGANTYQDTDFAERLTAKRDVAWFVNPKAIAYIVNPRHVFPKPERVRPDSENLAIWERKRAAGYPAVRGIK